MLMSLFNYVASFRLRMDDLPFFSPSNRKTHWNTTRWNTARWNAATRLTGRPLDPGSIYGCPKAKLPNTRMGHRGWQKQVEAFRSRQPLMIWVGISHRRTTETGSRRRLDAGVGSTTCGHGGDYATCKLDYTLHPKSTGQS